MCLVVEGIAKGLHEGKVYLAGSTGVLALSPARLTRGLTSSGLWVAEQWIMAGILPQCTAQDGLQSPKTLVSKEFSLITPATWPALMSGGAREYGRNSLRVMLPRSPRLAASSESQLHRGAQYKL